MKHRARPDVLIDAWQVGSEPIPHWIDVALANDDMESYQTMHGRKYCMDSDDGERLCAAPGDWIIRGTDGELYPCSDVLFKKKYEAVDE